ncbi:hypothetical protein EV421DRAFT_1849676 [Armillaria borealis]|uniref:Uncharacterized protein n=1 Tax=Armillaria borealis TaxID=47425 RepID=A0AA39IZ42_9AGAR|nr:hypothetical protein EV421DRAFT_1849676 [Armillaria borealis]
MYPYIKAVAPEVLGIFFHRSRKPHNPDGHLIAPLSTSFSLHGIPSGWSVHVHPQGLHHYLNDKTFDASTNTLSTPLYLSRRVLSESLDNIVSYMYAKGISLPPKVDLFLGLKLSPEGTTVCVYYFAGHVHRSVFWLDNLDARTLSIGGVVSTEPSHLAHAMEARYWSVLTYRHY